MPSSYIKAVRRRHEMAHRQTFTAINLFCGAGGLALGLEEAGFRTALAVDNWPVAATTFGDNFPDTPTATTDVYDLDRRKLLRMAGLSSAPDLIAGAPPAQGFSTARTRWVDDQLNDLVSKFADLVASVKPRAFLFLNAEGFLTVEKGQFVLDLLEPTVLAGYRVGVKKVNTANWDVPQLRKYVVVVGTLDSDTPVFHPTRQAYGSPGANKPEHANLPLTMTVDDALSGLGKPSDEPPGDPVDHYSYVPSRIVRRRIALLKEGDTMRDLPPRFQHPSYQRRANRRVSDGTPREHRGGAPFGIRRLFGDEPSKTITGNSIRELVHPHENRFLTLRECARLQTFPDWFLFAGEQENKEKLIANAVPPVFAKMLGKKIARALVNGDHKTKGGTLEYFDVTSTSNASPALNDVIRAVCYRFGLWGDSAVA